MGDVLQQNRFPGARRGDDERALPLADGGEQIQDSGGVVFGIELQVKFVLRIQGRQVVEQDFIAGLLRAFKVDFINLQQGKVFFTLLGGADFAGNRVAGAQIEAADL